MLSRARPAVFDDEILSRRRVGGVVHDVQLDSRGALVVIQVSGQEVAIFRLGHSGELREERRLAGTSPPASGWLPEVALHPHEPLAAVSCEGRPIMVFDLETGRRVAQVGEAGVGPRRGFWAVAFSHDGEHIETHALGPERGERYAWRSGELVGTRWGPGGAIARTTENGVLAICGVDDWTGAVHFGRWRDGELEWFEPMIHTVPLTRIRFAQGLFAVYGGTSRLHLQVHEFPSCEPRYCLLMDLLGLEDAEDYEVGNALGLSPGGDLIFVPTVDGELRALAPADARELGRWRAHRGLVTTCDVHPSQPWVISGGRDGDVVVSEFAVRGERAAPSGPVEPFSTRFRRISGSPANDLSRFLAFEAPDVEGGRRT